MAVQAALGSDIALAFDECTPYHADRDYTARSMERTHRWLDRCLAWHERAGPRAPGGVRDRPGRRPRGPARARRPSAVSAAAGRRDRDRRHAGPRQGGDARRRRDDRAACCRRTRPRTCSGSASPTTWSRGSRSGIDLFDCAVPTRLARHGMALAPLPGGAVPVRRAPRRAAPSDEAPLVEGCPCPACAAHTPRLRPLPLASRGADRRPAARPPQPHLPGAPGPAAPARRSTAGASTHYRERDPWGQAPWSAPPAAADALTAVWRVDEVLDRPESGPGWCA